MTEIDVRFPRLSGPYYRLEAEAVDDSERESVSLEDREDELIPFEDLAEGSRLELANAIHRDAYWTSTSHLINERFGHEAEFSYREKRYTLNGSVVVDQGRTGYGPERDPDWTDPVDIEVDTEKGRFDISMINNLGAELAVHHYGRPCFGVLAAVNGSPVVLDHADYEENDRVQTAGVVTAEETTSEEKQTESLATGDSLRESYTLPEDLQADSTIWLSLEIGDETMEMLRGRRTLMTAAVRLGA